MSAFKLKEGDYVVSVERTTSRTLMVSANGYYVNIDSSEIPTVGPRASGVKGIALKEDYLVGGYSIDSTHEYLTLITNNKTAKRIKISELETHNRAKKGSSLIKKVKSFDYQITKCLLTTARDEVCIIDHRSDVATSTARCRHISTPAHQDDIGRFSVPVLVNADTIKAIVC